MKKNYAPGTCACQAYAVRRIQTRKAIQRAAAIRPLPKYSSTTTVQQLYFIIINRRAIIAVLQCNRPPPQEQQYKYSNTVVIGRASRFCSTYTCVPVLGGVSLLVLLVLSPVPTLTPLRLPLPQTHRRLFRPSFPQSKLSAPPFSAVEFLYQLLVCIAFVKTERYWERGEGGLARRTEPCHAEQA